MRTLALLALFLLGTTTAFANTKITYLRCEYLESPLGIDLHQPRLSWNIESDERGQTQDRLSGSRRFVAEPPPQKSGRCVGFWQSKGGRDSPDFRRWKAPRIGATLLLESPNLG